MKRILCSLVMAVGVGGCVSMTSLSVSPIPKQRKRMVSAESTRFVFLGFNFDADYVDDATKDLIDKCNGSQVEGILLKEVETNYWIIQRHSVEARGYCVKG